MVGGGVTVGMGGGVEVARWKNLRHVRLFGLEIYDAEQL